MKGLTTVGTRTRDYQQMAIAILAVATAALGFAIWSQDFDFAYPAMTDSVITLLYVVSVVTFLIAIGFYFLTFITVGNILSRDRNVTGILLVRRPIAWLYFQMVTLSIMFLSGYASDLIISANAARTSPMG